MLRVDRTCLRCRAPRPWVKVRPEGAKASRRVCAVCGGTTRRIKGRRKRDTMPAPLYRYRVAVKAADRIWSQLVYTYAKPPGACARCGRNCGLQAMHIFGRKARPPVRLDPVNGIPGCPKCHLELTRDPMAHVEFCKAYLGPERYEALRLRSLCRAKVDVVAAGIALAALLQAAQGPERPYDEEDSEE